MKTKIGAIHLRYVGRTLEWPARFKADFKRYRDAGLFLYWYGTDYHYVLVVKERLPKIGGK